MWLFWLVGLVAEYIIEGLAKIPVEVEYASEFRYRKPVIYKDDIVIAFFQSGETDTLSVLKLLKKKELWFTVFGNVVGSSIFKISKCWYIYSRWPRNRGTAQRHLQPASVSIEALF